MRRYWIRAFALTGAFLAAMPIGAADDLPAALAACRNEPDDAKRLACFDRYAAEMTTRATAAKTGAAEAATAAAAGTTAGAAAAIPKTTVDPPAASAAPIAAASQAAAAQASAGAAPAAMPSTAEEKFGYTKIMARDEKKDEESELSEIVAIVTKLGTRAGGELVVTLDNGQVWVQKSAESNFLLKVGDQVGIKAGALGAFLMSRVSSDRATRVTRVR